ncbi:hypothetical protein EDC04DRAFT_1551141 [Pisolithus marmoratus]|nr:hypothetical protein EDC04DRAFT_1551141 [Pisolithus marmoratus]
MPINRGTYTFVNRQSGTAMEMGTDHSLMGMPPKENETQKWDISPLGAGHSIRNQKSGKYLSVKSLLKDAPIVASDYPVAWFIREVRVHEENAAFYEIRWPMTDIMLELADSGSSTPKTKILITDSHLTPDKHRARFWRANRVRQPSFYQPSPSANNTGNSTFSLAGLTEKWRLILAPKPTPATQT